MTLATCTPGWSWVAWCHCHGHLELQFEKWEHKLFSSWEQGMEVGVFAEKGGRVLSSLGEQWVGNWLSMGRGKVLDLGVLVYGILSLSPGAVLPTSLLNMMISNRSYLGV